MAYTVLRDSKDYDTWVSDIDAWTVDDRTFHMVVELYPTEAFDFTNSIVSYDNLIFLAFGEGNSPMDKPALSVFTDYLVVHKSTEQIANTAWFDNAQQISDMTIRYDAIKDAHQAMNLSAWTNTNEALMRKHIIENNDDTLMSELEALDITVGVSTDEHNSIQESKARREHGLDVIDYINHLNKAHIVTAQQLKDLYDHSDANYVKWLLESGALETAASTVTAMDISTIVTIESDRTKILAKINEY